MNEAKKLTVVESQELELKTGGLKFKKWCQYFLDPKETETYGNATQSALKAYKTKKYFNAGAIGHQNYKKLQSMGVTFSEVSGISIETWFKVASKKAMEGTYNEVIDFMRELGILDRPSSVPANQNNVQLNFGNLAEQFAQARKERGLDKIKPIEEIPDAEQTSN